MKRMFQGLCGVTATLVFFALPASADEPSETDRKIEVLAREIEALKAGVDLFPELGEGKHGLGPAASKVYGVRRGVSLGGYGEMLFQHFSDENESGAPSGKIDQIDFLRAVLYVGYKFSDRILFNSEIEFEHSTTERAGDVSVEFAYLDFLWKEAFNGRVGLVLLPVGWINELHEPTTFLGSIRPRVERRILPTTWREMGAGFFGNWSEFSYRAYVVNGMDAVGGGYSASGLRDGRQHGSEAKAESWAFSGRVDYEGVPGLVAGVSSYMGDAGQGNKVGGKTVGAFTSIVDGHIDARWKGVEVRGLVAFAHIEDADEINSARGFAGPQSVGDELFGYYAQVGYDVLRRLSNAQQLIPFYRFEALNSQQSVPSGFSKDLSQEETIHTIGVSYKPLSQLAAKMDYEIHTTKADTGVDQLNLSVGYLF